MPEQGSGVTDAALYPSYVDLDPLIDVGSLRALDGYVCERLKRRLSANRCSAEGDTRFYTGPFVLDERASTLPGTRMVYLTRSDQPDDYYDLDRCELWRRSEEADEFSELLDFIETLPFKSTGRMLLMYDPDGRPVTAHRDHDSIELCHEFVWLRTNLSKPFYVFNPSTEEKRYIAGYSAWFDTVNQYHGADATGDLSWSIRIDGRFSDAFRALIPPSSQNPASSAALWQKRILEADAAG